MLLSWLYALVVFPDSAMYEVGERIAGFAVSWIRLSLRARVRQLPLVVAKVDRLTRSVAFLSRLLEAGVDVRFADLPAIEGERLAAENGLPFRLPDCLTGPG